MIGYIMDNCFVKKIESVLKELQFEGVTLLRESFDEQHFGNGYALYKLKNLFLQFSRDRGDEFVDFLNPEDLSEVCTFDDVSIVLGWKTLQEMLKEGKRTSFVDPPHGPISLEQALRLVKDNIPRLQQMFSRKELPDTLDKVRNARTMRCKAFFG